VVFLDILFGSISLTLSFVRQSYFVVVNFWSGVKSTNLHSAVDEEILYLLLQSQNPEEVISFLQLLLYF